MLGVVAFCVLIKENQIKQMNKKIWSENINVSRIIVAYV